MHECTSFFDETGTSRRKIPAAEWTRGAQRRGRGGRVCFLLVIFSLHKQRKVTRSPKGSESTCLDFDLPFEISKAATTEAESKALAPLRGSSAPFFAYAKQRGPKRRLFNNRMAGQVHPAYAPSALRAPGSLRWQDFSTIHPCIVKKRRTSLCVAPFGVLSASSVAAEGDLVDQKLKQQHKQKAPSPQPLSRFAGEGLWSNSQSNSQSSSYAPLFNAIP